VIDAKDVITQLAVLSDDQLIKDTQLHVALLYQPGTLIRLLELEDLYVQFSAYRLVKAILLNHNGLCATISATDGNSQLPPLLCNNRQLVIRMLVQKLVNIHQSCSGTGRAILELFHGLLKDHRHLVRNLGYHDNNDTDDSNEEEEATVAALSQHIALTVIQELMTCPEFWDEAALNKILYYREMQYAVLVLMIDIEKARVFGAAGAGDGFWKSVMSCHNNIVQCMDKWMAKDRIGLLPPKKHLELICISMKPSSPSQQQSHERFVGQDMRRALEVLIALSPLLLDTLQKFQEQDPDLEDFSAGRTTFIVLDNPNASLLNNPEAVRQLGQICLTAVLTILDNLDLSDKGDEIGDDIRNDRKQIIELTSSYLIPFLEEWLGDRTLSLLLTVYGEDDAGVSWLLRTMSRIYRSLLTLKSSSHHPSSLVHTTPSTSTTTTPTIPRSSAVLLLDKVQGLLEKHAHPVESLILFLETVGFDYQTILDLLLTLDDHESGGMLAAVMSILRSFTEDTVDQKRIVERWRQEIIQDQQLQPLQQEQAQEDQEEHRLELLSNVHHCLAQLSHQIRRLYKNNLFPYNPKPLLHVLDRTQDILSTLVFFY
ncbi:hypothetical protein BGZ95_004200, partial [Linnemannia exigua]